MSKLLNMYKILKSQDAETLYLFKSGIFHIFLDEDAKKINSILNLKLTNLNSETLKCGFPSNSLSKYSNIFKEHNLPIRIIDANTNTAFNVEEYSQEKVVQGILEQIRKIDIDSISIKEAYQLLENLKKQASKI